MKPITFTLLATVLLLAACNPGGNEVETAVSAANQPRPGVVELDRQLLDQALEGHEPVPTGHVVAANIADIVIARHDLVVCSVVNHLKTQALQIAVEFKIDGESQPGRELNLQAGEGTELEFELPAPMTGRHLITVTIEYDQPTGLAGWEEAMEFRPVERSLSIDVNDFTPVRQLDFIASIDGDLANWQEVNYLTMNSSEPGQDLEARLRLGWDREHFHLAVEVSDDYHVNNQTGSNIWNGDAIQFAIAPRADSDDIFNLGLALTADRVRTHQWMGPASEPWEHSQYTVVRNDDKRETYYQAKIPFERLKIIPAPGLIFSFNAVIFDDKDGSGYDYWLELTPGLAGGWEPGQFNQFILLE